MILVDFICEKGYNYYDKLIVVQNLVQTVLYNTRCLNTKIILEVIKMGRMYNIARYVPMNNPTIPGALNGEETFHGLEKAKIAMRETVTKKFGAGVEKFTNKIDEYCQKYYGDNTPIEFINLKNLIIDVITNPAFPKSEKDLVEKYDWFDFKDDRIRFEFDSALLCVSDEGLVTVPMLEIEILGDDKEIFLEGLISCFVIKDFPYDDIVYRCWLSSGVFFGLDIELTLVPEDEE